MDELKTCEVLIDTGSVNVSAERYGELVSAEEKLKIIEKMYYSETSSYNYDTLFGYIFGKKGAVEDVE